MGKPVSRWWTYLELNWFSYVVNWAMVKAPNTVVIVRNIFIDPLGHSLRKRQRPSPYARPWSKRTKSMSSIGVVLMLLRWRRFLSHHPLGGREFVRGRLSASPWKEIVWFYFSENFLDQYSLEGRNECFSTSQRCQNSGHIDATREDCSQSTGDVLQIGCC